jgi:hypothetical protein
MKQIITFCFTNKNIINVRDNNGNIFGIEIQLLEPCMEVQTTNGYIIVQHVLASKYKGIVHKIEDGPEGTPLHPVWNEDKWVPLKNHSKILSSRYYDGFVYNIVFKKGDSHDFILSGIACASLGHGLTSIEESDKSNEYLVHEYYGNHDRIIEDFNRMTINGLGQTIWNKESSIMMKQ